MVLFSQVTLEQTIVVAGLMPSEQFVNYINENKVHFDKLMRSK